MGIVSIPAVPFLAGTPLAGLPLGVFPVGILVGVVLYLAARRARRNATRGVEIRPLQPNPVPTMPPVLRKAIHPSASTAAPSKESEWSEEHEAIVDASRARFPGTIPQPVSLPSRRGYGTYVVQPAVEGPAPPGGVQAQPPPPGATGFGWKIAIAYAVLAGPLLALSPYFMARLNSWLTGAPFPTPAPPTVPYFFSYYDTIVHLLGEVVFWPIPWPGPPDFLQGPNVLGHTIADFIFTMYLVLMLAFLLASGLLGRASYTVSQRGMAFGVTLGYVVVSLFTEVFFFSIRPGFAYSSVALLGRAFVGGLFVALLLFVILVAPPVMLVRPRLARRPGDIRAFVGTATVALACAFVLLFVGYVLLGVGRSQVIFGFGPGSTYVLSPFGLLLLLPLIALTLWALMGRALYTHQLARRRVPPLSVFHPPVSVLIPAYNEEATISATIRGVDQAARLYPGSVEILVGNDGSKDRTSAVAREALGHLHHSYGQVVDLPHGGKSSALNGALRSSRGEVVIRLDADTRLSPEYGFSAMIPHFADPEVGGVQGLLLPLQKEGWTRKLRMLELVWNHLFLRPANYGTGTAQVVDGAFCAFRRQDLLTGGGWVPWNGEDTEITYRLARMGFRFRFETRGVAYEDVPANYRAFKKQRIRWTRGGYFAHHRHYGSLFSVAPEFAGLAMVYWLTLFVRGAMRHLVYIYAALLTFLLGLQTLWHVALILGLLLVPRGIVMAYYLVRLRAYAYLPWILFWPIGSAVKQFITMEGYGTILPGAIPEFSE